MATHWVELMVSRSAAMLGRPPVATMAVKMDHCWADRLVYCSAGTWAKQKAGMKVGRLAQSTVVCLGAQMAVV